MEPVSMDYQQSIFNLACIVFCVILLTPKCELFVYVLSMWWLLVYKFICGVNIEDMQHNQI